MDKYTKRDILQNSSCDPCLRREYSNACHVKLIFDKEGKALTPEQETIYRARKSLESKRSVSLLLGMAGLVAGMNIK